MTKLTIHVKPTESALNGITLYEQIDMNQLNAFKTPTTQNAHTMRTNGARNITQMNVTTWQNMPKITNRNRGWWL